MIFLFLQWQEKIREVIHQRRRKLRYTISKHPGEIQYQTREGVFHLISKHWEVICQTREGVFHPISKPREVIYETQGVFHLISKHREVIYQTREKVFYRICKDRKVINKTRESVSYLTPDTKMSYVCQTREGVFILYSKNKFLDWKRARRKVTRCQMKDSLRCTISRLNLRPKLE